MPLVLDIETVGQEEAAIPPRALDYLRRSIERDGPDEVELERRYRELVSRFGLDPTTGRVIVVGTIDSETGEAKSFTGANEKELLEAFWAWLAVNEPARYVSFNGKRFDVPFLNVRSAVHGLKPRVSIPLELESIRRHFDVREVLEGHDRRRRGSLDYFSAVFGLPSPKQAMDGASVGAFYAEGRLDEIERYCLEDCRATLGLYERLAPFYR